MASYARIEVTIIALLGLALAVAVGVYLGVGWALLPTALTAAVLSFYRDPSRKCPQDARLILAPADGRVVRITQDAAQREIRIMIFLSVLNVHVNRSPCAGGVSAVEFRPGRFLNALDDRADAENEAATITLQPDGPIPGPVRVRQIAGLLARRIVCRVRVGDRLAAGQRYGMIKLGSRTETTLADDGGWEILVKTGESVRGGLSVLARRR